MSKVLLHNLSIPFLGQSADFFEFDTNALFYAGEGDVVILRKEIDTRVAMYYKGIEIIPQKYTMILAENTGTPFDIFFDKALKGKVRKATLGSARRWDFDTFLPSTYEYIFAKELSLDYIYPQMQYETYVGKSYFRETAGLLGLPILPGFGYVRSRREIILKMLSLYLRGVHEVVIKQDDGVSGNGFKRLTRNNFLKCLFTFDFGVSQLFPKTHVYPALSKGHVLEEWLRDVQYAPSCQFCIDIQGNVSIVSVHNQLMRENEVTYAGCQSRDWLPAEVVQKLEMYTLRYAEGLHKKGFVGYGALGSIVDSCGNIFFTELNPRRVISSYSFQIMQKLGRSGEKIYPYMAYEIFNKNWIDKDAQYILTKYKDILYTKEKGSGIIPFDMRLLTKEGRCIILALAPAKEEVNHYIDVCKT